MSAVITTSGVTRIGKPAAAWHFGQAIGKRQSFTSMKCLGVLAQSKHIVILNYVSSGTMLCKRYR